MGKREQELLLDELSTLAEAPENGGKKVYCPAGWTGSGQ
jgi:hypothetical protein